MPRLSKSIKVKEKINYIQVTLALLAEHLAAFIALIAGVVKALLMESNEFLRLKRELQQFVPIPKIFSHIDHLLSLLSPLQFQLAFIKHIIHTSSIDRFDSGLLAKLSAYIFKNFDKIYCGGKYAFEDEFVDFFSGSNARGDGKCDRFYEIGQERVIHIRCSESLISEGTTGYSLWEASVVLLASLADSMNKLKDRFHNKRVLELGSGTGLGGLAIAALASPQSILLSDVSQVHDAYTKPNIFLNPKITLNIDSKVIYWNDLVSEAEEYAGKFDTIVGCDLVYDPEICSHLFSAFKALLTAKSSSINHIVLFCTLRNPQTFDDFVRDLRNEKSISLSVEELCYDPNNPIILNSIESFRILVINKVFC